MPPFRPLTFPLLALLLLPAWLLPLLLAFPLPALLLPLLALLLLPVLLPPALLLPLPPPRPSLPGAGTCVDLDLAWGRARIQEDLDGSWPAGQTRPRRESGWYAGAAREARLGHWGAWPAALDALPGSGSGPGSDSDSPGRVPVCVGMLCGDHFGPAHGLAVGWSALSVLVRVLRTRSTVMTRLLTWRCGLDITARCHHSEYTTHRPPSSTGTAHLKAR